MSSPRRAASAPRARPVKRVPEVETPMIEIRAAGLSDVGRKRKSNEDSFATSDDMKL